MINFRDYLDYSKLESLELSFLGVPTKNDSGAYETKFDQSVFFAIPRSSIKEIEQDSKGRYYCNYEINDNELIEFMNGLQSNIINKIYEHSQEWFKKTIEMDKIIELCNNIYNDDNTLTILIEDEDLIEDISDYNADDECNLVIKLRNVEIFKNAIKIKVAFEDIVYENHYTDDTADDVTDDESKSVTDDVVENIEEDLATLERMERNLTKTYLIETRGFNLDRTDDKEDVRSEVLELIKKKEKKRVELLRNSERAQSASLSLKDQASMIDLEIDSYKKRLNSLN